MKRFAKKTFDGGGNRYIKNQIKSKDCISKILKNIRKDYVITVLSICCSMFALVCCYLNIKEKNDYPEFSQYFEKQTESKDKQIYSVLGCDTRGEVQLTENSVVRTTVDSYLDIVKKTFERYKAFAKEHSDIVETKMEGKKLLHKRYITTYPHEWTANMIKDAIIFDFQLALKLRKYGLLLTDFVLRNNIFNYTQPIYVDFHGIVTEDIFNNEKSQFLFTNENDNISQIWDRSQIEREGPIEGIRVFIQFALKKDTLTTQRKNISNIDYYVLSERTEDKWGIFKELHSTKSVTEIYKSLINLIQSIPVGSCSHPNQYPATYYSDKHENFDHNDRTNWLPKQNSIYEILSKYKPKTVIDIGCNTGWFSILSERFGSKVISIDADDGVVDNLYLYSKKHKLNILPLKISFEDLDKKYIYKKYPFANRKKSFESKELFAAPILRLKSDLTLCLALVHHLVLAYGMNIEKVMNILSRITKKVLVLEVPDLQDSLIRRNLSYYRYAKNATLDQYSMDRFIEEGWKHFRKIEIYPSHPRTRKIIVFEK